MLKMTYFRGIGLTFIVLTIIGTVKARWLELEPYPTSSMISDGIHDASHENTRDYLIMGASSSSVSTTMLYGEKRCESIYGFLPCADTIAEGVFLMFLYTGLMILMEGWIAKGSKALLLLLGDYKVIGAGVFRVLMAFPRIVLVIVAGIVSTESAAQNQVEFGLRMYAGSTLITLTLIWGFCILINNDKLQENDLIPEYDQHQEDSSTKCLPLKYKLSILNDSGVNIDKGTREIAAMMLLSLIPFVTVELIVLINSRVTILFALIVSVVSLVSYFAYQIWKPWIQVRSLAYLKEENLRTRFFYHVQKLAEGKLIDEHGKPNFEEFKRIFNIADEDGSNHISCDELDRLIIDVFELEKDHISKEYANAEIFAHFDDNNSGFINWEEFQNGCTKWLKKWKNHAHGSNSVTKSVWKQVERVAIENKREDLTRIEKIMPRILMHSLDRLVNENGDADRDKIKRYISQYDLNRDKAIHRDEFKKFIERLPFGVDLHDDAIFDKLAKDFVNEDNVDTIGENEFVEGFIKWIDKAIKYDPSIKDAKSAILKFDEEWWIDIDKTNNMMKPKARIFYVIFGVPIMFLISGAFMQSIQQFSNAADIPFHLTSFVVFPIVMNLKMFIKPFLNARPHVSKNASLAFSEIYNGLVMNNLLGLLTLIAIVYAKGLSWTYSTEVLTIMIPCLVVGVFALMRDTYPLWASVSAMLLYPIYVCIFCVFGS